MSIKNKDNTNDNNQDLTYQLEIKGSQDLLFHKEDIISFLEEENISSFVEGCVDNIFLDDNSDAFSNYESFNGNLSAISIFKYDLKELQDLQKKLEERFKDSISCKISSLKTESWKSGWKDSFKPIKTKKFYIYPPWESLTSTESLLGIKIDPGMAFGTGQHPTSILCLEAIEDFYDSIQNNKDNKDIKRCLDIGTGTGILAIALKKLFPTSSVIATDIDIDAINACNTNAKENHVDIQTYKGSTPDNISSSKFDIVVANILAPILKQLIVEIHSLLNKNSIFIISGILKDDIDDIVEIYSKYGLKLKDQYIKNDWACCSFIKEEK